MILGRFILRFILVPLGWCVAMTVAALIIIIANWDAFLAVGTGTVEQQHNFWVLLLIFGPILMLALGFAAVVMMALSAIGVMFSELFAIRSWIFHALTGGLSAAIGWTMIRELRNELQLVGDLKIIVAAGLAAGFCYWLIAGWSAGFWKPVFNRELPPAPAPPARAA
jgi:hypothetical protein